MVDTRNSEPGKNRRGDQPPTDEAALSARLTRLDQQLSHVKKDRAVEKSQAESEGQAAHARFLLLGFTAGVMNVMRSAGQMAKQSERLKDSPKS